MRARTAALLSVALFVGTTARADDVFWDNSDGGFFQIDLNWAPEVIPGSDDRAVFDLFFMNGPVFHLADEANDQLRLDATSVTMQLDGHTYELLNTEDFNVNQMSVQVGNPEGAVLTVEGPGTLLGREMVVGVSSAASSEVLITNGATVDAQTGLRIAALGGEGYVTVEDGLLTAPGTLMSQGGPSHLFINGPNAEAQFLNGFSDIGRGDVAEVEVTGGGAADFAIAVLGQNSTGTGTMTVTDSSSMVTASTIIVGSAGDGTMRLQNDAQATVYFDTFVARDAGSTGSFNIESGADMEVQENFAVGGDDMAAGGTGVANIVDGRIDILNRTEVWSDGDLFVDDNGIVVDRTAVEVDGGLLEIDGKMVVSNDLGPGSGEPNELRVDGSNPVELSVSDSGSVLAPQLNIGTIAGGQGIVTATDASVSMLSSNPTQITVGNPDDAPESAQFNLENSATTLADEITVEASGVIDASAVGSVRPGISTDFLVNNGIVRGVGGVFGNFQNNNEVVVGDPYGALNVFDGDYQQTVDGSLEVRIGGAGLLQSSRLRLFGSDVPAQAFLDGTLRVRVDSGASGGFGATINVVDVPDGRSGQFADVELIDPTGAYRIVPVYEPDAVNITVTCRADIAGSDATVDVFDLFELLDNWGTNGTGADLAAPNDVVDVFDLFALLDAWGSC